METPSERISYTHTNPLFNMSLSSNDIYSSQPDGEYLRPSGSGSLTHPGMQNLSRSLHTSVLVLLKTS